MNLNGSLPMNDFATSYTGHLENDDSMSYVGFPNVDSFIIQALKMSNLLITQLTSQEKNSLRVRKLSSLQWQIRTFQNCTFLLKSQILLPPTHIINCFH